MDRKEYWEGYVDYFKALTVEADEGGLISNIKKETEGDYKTPGEKVIIEFLSSLQYKKTEKLLDYGCGYGRFYPFLSQAADYYGIDISQAMIDECINRYPKEAARFIVAEGEALPFDDSFFDKVICYGVFDACYQENAIFEMLRVTKLGGTVLVTGKNINYHVEDEQALIAEEAARKKGHPNYFTDVKNMLQQLSLYIEVIQERYFDYRGDFSQAKFVTSMPNEFYEWALILKKKKNLTHKLEKFSDIYSNTWRDIK